MASGIQYSGPSEGLKIRWCQYYLVGTICPPPLVEIGLTDLPKSGGFHAMAWAPLAPIGTTGLVLKRPSPQKR